MKMLFTVFCLLSCLMMKAQRVLPDARSMLFTFKLITAEGIGTCFVVADSANTYLVTAKHMFGKPKNGQQVSFAIDTGNNRMKLTGTVYTDTAAAIDVAVITPDKFSSREGISLKYPAVALGIQGYFLGFPFNMSTPGNPLSDFPIPLVKMCLLSGVNIISGIGVYLLDAQNNPGFSGGPVFLPTSLSFNNTSSNLLGIISGYYQQFDSTRSTQGAFQYAENSGIMIVYGSEVIKRIFRENNLKFE